jgi:hypothetical protein
MDPWFTCVERGQEIEVQLPKYSYRYINPKFTSLPIHCIKLTLSSLLLETQQ